MIRSWNPLIADSYGHVPVPSSFTEWVLALGFLGMGCRLAATDFATVVNGDWAAGDDAVCLCEESECYGLSDFVFHSLAVIPRRACNEQGNQQETKELWGMTERGRLGRLIAPLDAAAKERRIR